MVFILVIQCLQEKPMQIQISDIDFKYLDTYSVTRLKTYFLTNFRFFLYFTSPNGFCLGVLNKSIHTKNSDMDFKLSNLMKFKFPSYLLGYRHFKEYCFSISWLMDP